jgi:ankyrin repeat protein
MSSDSSRGSRSLPANPDLRHLKDQAKDLLRADNASSLSDAQFQIAREYGFASWPKLKAHVESLKEVGQLKAAIDENDLARVRELMTRNPALHRAPLGYNKNGPLTWAAECRGAAPTPERLAIVRWMLENGSDVHQGGDGPLMRAALDEDRIGVMELLVAHGADVNARWDGRYPIILAPCETLQAAPLRWLIAHGADMRASSDDYGNCVQMLIGTYWRDAPGKHACLEVFAEAGYSFPDTGPMAVHRGRVDLLAECLQRDPQLLDRRFSTAEIYPAELGVGAGYHVAPVEGGTLLHLAVEYQETEIARWLIEHGADVNARSRPEADDAAGHSPLFHTTVTLVHKKDELARLLLDAGADPNLRATFRKQLVDMGDEEKEQMKEYRDVTPIGFAEQFVEPNWVNPAAIEAIREYGGA